MDAYMYQADLYCESCINKIKETIPKSLIPEDAADEESYDSDDYPKGPYDNGGGEADSFQHCASCNCFLGNPLTSDGVINEGSNFPDVEYMHMSKTDIEETGPDSCWYTEDGKEKEPFEPGYYYWYCQPGCLPDSDPHGPFKTIEEAYNDVLDNNWPEEGY